MQNCKVYKNYCCSQSHDNVAECHLYMAKYYATTWRDSEYYTCPTCETTQKIEYTLFLDQHLDHLKQFHFLTKKVLFSRNISQKSQDIRQTSMESFTLKQTKNQTASGKYWCVPQTLEVPKENVTGESTSSTRMPSTPEFLLLFRNYALLQAANKKRKLNENEYNVTHQPGANNHWNQGVGDLHVMNNSMNGNSEEKNGDINEMKDKVNDINRYSVERNGGMNDNGNNMNSYSEDRNIMKEEKNVEENDKSNGNFDNKGAKYEKVDNYESIFRREKVEAINNYEQMNNDGNIITTDSDMESKIEGKLMKSFVNQEEAMLGESEGVVHATTDDECVEGIKMLEHRIKLRRQKELRDQITIGRLISKIRLNDKGSMVEIFDRFGLVYKLSHARMLMDLFWLFDKSPILYSSSETISFFKKNYEIIKKIAAKNKW